MRTLTALWLSVALLGCKEKQQAPESAPAAPQARSSKPGERPSLPSESAPGPQATPSDGAPAEKAPSKPISVADAAAVLPKIQGTEVLGLKQTSDQGQVHGTWCIDGTSADDVAKQVGHQLAQSGYTNISIRGDARKAGVVGDRDGVRLSMVVSASSAAVCQAPAHYFASATLFRL